MEWPLAQAALSSFEYSAPEVFTVFQGGLIITAVSNCFPHLTRSIEGIVDP